MQTAAKSFATPVQTGPEAIAEISASLYRRNPEVLIVCKSSRYTGDIHGPVPHPNLPEHLLHGIEVGKISCMNHGRDRDLETSLNTECYCIHGLPERPFSPET